MSAPQQLKVTAYKYRVSGRKGGYVGAGFAPVDISPTAVAMVDLMLLEHGADFKFQTWAEMKTNDPVVSNFISIGSSEEDAQKHYDNLRQNKPAALASLLNLATAMKTIHLPSKTPLDYFKEILWDESMAQDRFFGYADKSLVDQVRRAAMEHQFVPEPGPGLFHPNATSSFKQVQFGEANVQLTFHEKDTKKIDGAQCIKVEPDIDCYQDLGAHTLPWSRFVTAKVRMSPIPELDHILQSADRCPIADYLENPSPQH
jgi:hypothetical protein